tara:strand:+ start:462 stop:665 length:204 start_codon:yes stop_codon:yes gene_type:complete
MSKESYEQQRLILEERKTKAVEKIARCLDALTLWFEEIDKDGWNERTQYYLSEFKKLVPEDEPTEES